MTTTPQSPNELRSLQVNQGISYEDEQALVQAVMNCSPFQKAQLALGISNVMREYSEELIRQTQHEYEDEYTCEVEETDNLVMQSMDMKSWRIVQRELRSLSYLEHLV